ncbi:CHAT domain-containing tetratricopeptide repeat protein [Thalassoglobus polymorphus]|uniref:CHAT domain protein n=1 Tax=Thalassoglobus polymorphus TaxID=2527994 RepID=A0A517QMV8_9PLAN|nr:CHAT domain-containing tetratricopeptide repeat protein [Thalassoglobus polymorphus]QDT32951.1 CHAT domain protein [Thalassoglobus polymorphus]
MNRIFLVVTLLFSINPATGLGQADFEATAAHSDLNQARIELNRKVQETWKNGNVSDALDMGLQLLGVEQKLFNGKEEENIRIAERYVLLCNYALELNQVERARRFLDSAIRRYRQNAPEKSWQQSEAEHLELVINKLLSLPLTDRQELFGSARELQLTMEGNDPNRQVEAAENYARLSREIFGERAPLAIMAMMHVQSAQLRLGRLETVGTQLERLRIELQQVEHPEHPNHAALMYLLAEHSAYLGKTEISLDYVNKSIEHFRQSGASYQGTCISAKALKGYLLISTGQHHDALAPLREAYSTGKREGLLPSHIQIIADQFCIALQRTARAEWEEQNWERAEQLAKESYEIALEQWGEENFRTIEIRIDPVMTVDRQSWTKEQKETYQQIQSLHQQMQSLIQAGEQQQAVEIAKQRYAKLADLFGRKNSETLRARFDVLDLLTDPKILGEQDHAILVSQINEFLRVTGNVFGKTHPFYATACMDFAEHFDSSSPERFKLTRESVTGFRTAFSENSDEYIEALTVLGCLLAKHLDEEAIEHLSKAIELWESRPSRGCYAHSLAIASLGGLYYNLDDPYEARHLLAKAVDLFRNNQNDNVNYDLAVTLNYLGNIAGVYGRYFDGIKYYEEAISLFENNSSNLTAARFGKSLNDYTGTYQWCLYNASEHYSETGDFENAEQVLKKLIARYPDESPIESYRSALYSLTIVYAQQDRYDEATKLLQKVSRIVEKHFDADPLVRGKFFLKSGHAALLADRKREALQQLDLALVEYQKIDDLNKIDRVEWGYFDNDLLWLRKYYEQLHAWDRVAEVREFAQDSEAILYSDAPDVLRRLEQELELARRIAALTGEDLAAYEQLFKDTQTLKDHNNVGIDPQLLGRSESILKKSTETLGPLNLAMMNYAKAAATYFEEQENYQQAISMSILAYTCGASKLGSGHPDSLTFMTRNSRLMRALGQYQEALSFSKKSVFDTAQSRGDEDIDTFAAQFELAQVYAEIEDYSSALPLARSASEGFRRLWGTENREYANAIRLLGEIYYGIGEPRLAHAEILRSHEIIQRLKEVTERDRLRSAATVAVSTATDDSRKIEARERFEEVLNAYEVADRAESAEFFELLIEYGDAQLRWDDIEKATKLFEQAVIGLAHRKSHYKLQQSAQQKLGIAQRKNGQFEQARDNLTEALNLQRKLFGAESRVITETLFQLAIVEHVLGEDHSALKHVENSLQLQQRQLSEIGRLLSDTSLTSLLDQDERPLDLLISIINKKQPAPSDIRMALDWTMQRKGLSLDLNCRLKTFEQSQSFDSETLNLIEKLRVLNQELADLTLGQDGTRSESELAAQRRQKQREISEEQGKLNERLHNLVAANSEFQLDTDQLSSKLESNTAYIEFLKVNRFAAGASGYIAFFVRRENEQTQIQFADLGNAEEIDDLIEELREQTRRFPRMLRLSTEEELETRYRQLSQNLYHRLLGPFEEHLDQVTILTISPDAGISGVPFSALVDNSDHYLVETKEISYVSSARDLTRKHEPPGVGTLVISNPNFDAEVEVREQVVAKQQEQSQNLVALRGANGIDLRSLRWKRLPGAELEADDVQTILSSTAYQPVNVFVGDAAVEEVFKSVHAARIVHLATHGFYVPSAEEDEFERGSVRSTSNLSRLRAADNPLLRSGIVLAGANRSSSVTNEKRKLEDGWVTAQEIARLNFRNTELVVLSACESGLGDVSSGQGVHGIRRAFMNAGAHSILTTLFEVPDGETRDLIRAFYEELAARHNRRSAISQAQRTQIEKRRAENNAAHPFYWASFVLYGDVE